MTKIVSKTICHFAKLSPESVTTLMVDSPWLLLIKTSKKSETVKNVLELLQGIEENHNPYVFSGKDDISRLTDINNQVNAIKKRRICLKIFVPYMDCDILSPA